MTNVRWTTVAAIALAAALAGCAARESAPAPAEQAAAPTYPPPPADSPLAKVKPGMSMNDVGNLLGAPTSQNTYISGKQFIPFYYGNDAQRTAYFYKGMGRVVFAAGNVFGGQRTGEVVGVEYDPSESGVAR